MSQSARSQSARPAPRGRRRVAQRSTVTAVMATAALVGLALTAAPQVSAAAPAPAAAAGSATLATASGVNWWEASTPQTPDSEVDVTGAPATGTAADGSVRGLIDAHTHMFSDASFGGNVVCGKTFDPDGVAEALADCHDHQPDGRNATIENLTDEAKGGNPFATHDPTGWPSFNDWPTPTSFTHQQMYHKWVERAWRGGQRILVNHFVNNTGLCKIQGLVHPPNRYTCDDMDSIRRQAKEVRDLEAFIDGQFGGPGRGWFRIVTDEAQARQVIAAGRLAVFLGVEVSEPFGCRTTLGVPNCSRADIDRGLDELHGLGVRTMFLCHKFDNALCGVRYDEGTTGAIVNAGQWLTTGTWWTPQTCTAGQVPDHTVATADLGGLATRLGLPPNPIVPPAPHCNPRGLTDLGEYALRGMMKRHMVVEVDHMSAKAADAALSIMEQAGYPGAVSSHSWLAPQYQERVYRLGGFVTQYGHDAVEFVREWQAARPLLAKYHQGYGFGMDMNGFGGTPMPRGTAAAPPTNPVRYPFTSVLGDAVLDRQRTGDRVWDVNVDGVAHYGQVPDWVADLRTLGGQPLIDDLLRGPESYLRMLSATRTHTPLPNLALGRAATASSTQWSLFGDFVPRRATDGSAGTRWASHWTNREWWRVDLGAVRTIDRVALQWEAAHADRYDVLTSVDGVTWTRAASVTKGNGGLDTVVFDPRPARFVKVDLLNRASGLYGYSFFEVTVH